MAELSKISWTKSSFNPWIGCTKVSPGCDNCYAAVSTPARAMKIEWGPGKPRHRTRKSNWQEPLKWNRQAPDSEFAGRKGFWPVFCASLADVFDNEVPYEWRHDLFWLISETPNLSWLLVTKRIGNAMRMLEEVSQRMLGLPFDPARWPNVRIMITVVNQEEADRDIPKLLALRCKNGISYEPALGRVDFGKWLELGRWDATGRALPTRGINWIIVGGESDQSGALARPFNINWARDVIGQCDAAGVPVFIKQLGSSEVRHMGLRDRAGADPAEWPEDLRVQEFPR